VEDVHDHLEVIENDPLAGGKSIDGDGPNSVVFPESRLNLARDRLELRLRSCGTNYEEIGEARNCAKIQNEDFFRLLVGGEIRAGLG
jgi:hypothetical protein